MMNGKTYNQGVINHIQFFKNIDKIIKLVKTKYTKLITLSSYINAITSILSLVREYFPNEYNKIAQINIDLSKQYQRERDTNDAPDKAANLSAHLMLANQTDSDVLIGARLVKSIPSRLGQWHTFRAVRSGLRLWILRLARWSCRVSATPHNDKQ
jgi:hypothetical protein